jgi:hypothetical protein
MDGGLFCIETDDPIPQKAARYLLIPIAQPTGIEGEPPTRRHFISAPGLAQRTYKSAPAKRGIADGYVLQSFQEF